MRSGGNAFDAVVAAGFAAAVAEPTLSSLGGGGFLLASPAAGKPVVLDFFVDAPGRGRPPADLEPHFLPVKVHWTGAQQVFHAGWGSVAVPGCLDGYLNAHRRLGRLPLADVVEPARRLAAEGAVLDAAQAEVIALLGEILTLTPDGREVFAPRGRLLEAGERLHNEALAALLADVASGRVASFSDPQIGEPLVAAMQANGGLVTAKDLVAYEVVEREPLVLAYRGATIATNPAPSFGGGLVTRGLRELGDEPVDASPAAYSRLCQVLVAMSERHVQGPASVRGTTHVSVVDAEGNVAAMTTSNGSCSGTFAPGTGIQLNNVMGEADLHPEGFHVTPPGTRIGSMMAPSVVRRGDGSAVGLGSGGSERIRSALTCVLSGLLDRGLGLEDAVRAPRLHWDRAQLQVEPGLPVEVARALAERWPANVWSARDLYFGGVHSVAVDADGEVSAVGDDRRGGAGVVVDLR
nr:gamma-glutamyltransferase [Motilibacter deserti]